MAKGKGQINGWITKNGVHIPIYGEYTVRGGVEPKTKGAKFKGKKKRPDKYTNPRTGKRDHVQGKTQADLNQALKEQGLELDGAYQRVENEEKVYMYDKDGNVYSGTFNKYRDGGREIVNIEKDTLNGESNVRNLDPDRDEHIRNGESKGAKREEAIKKQVNERFKTAKELKAEGKWDISEEEKDKKSDRDEVAKSNHENMLAVKERIREKEAMEDRKQSFRDKKAQEQGFADDASMRSYNEETGVNEETWRTSPNELIRNYEAKKKAKQEESKPRTSADNREERIAALKEKINAKTQERVEEYRKDDPNYKDGKYLKEQESSKSSFSPESSAQTINDMARRRANGGGKNDDWKTAQSVLESAPAGTTMIQTGNRGVKFQYTKGEDDKWHSTSGEEYTKDSKTLSMSWVGQSGPSVEFTTSDKALTKDQIKDSHTAAVNGRLNQHLAIDNNGRSIGNRSVPKVDNSLTPQSVKEQTKRDVQAKLESNYAKVKKATSSGTEKVTATPKSYSDMTLSGLKEALAGARPGDKTKIRAELRKRGYTYIGGKWVKGSKS